jgi:hypothetical protein
MDPFGGMIRLIVVILAGVWAVQGAYYIVQMCQGLYGMVFAAVFIIMTVYTLFMILLRR